MTILAFDTATALSTVALVGPGVSEEVSEIVGSRHAEITVAQIADLTRDVHVDAIAVGIGPGPYTSTRVGVSTARALGLAWGIPVYGLCTLDVIARAVFALGATDFCVSNDARRKELYWAPYQPRAGKLSRADGPFVSQPHDLPQSVPTTWAGNGWARHEDELRLRCLNVIEIEYPSALVMAQMAQEALALGNDVSSLPTLVSHGGHGEGASDAVLFEPLPMYIRRPDAVEPAVVR